MELTGTGIDNALMESYYKAISVMRHGSVELIDKINNHIELTKGKQLRPVLMILSASCCGMPHDIHPNHPLFALAAAIETLHTSTLLHDDVIDESDTRRGHPSINSIWNNKTAVLMGDFYLAKVISTIFEIDNKHVTDIICNTIVQMAEGELLQQQCAGNPDTDKATYLEIVRKKTALLISASCHIGASLFTSDTTIQHAARDFGQSIGIAFQIRDDMLDYQPTALSGKPQGNDLKEHRPTLPLIYALQSQDSNVRETILSLWRKPTLNDQETNRIIELVRQTDAFHRCSRDLRQHIAEAKQCLKNLPSNTYNDTLSALAERISILPILNQ